MPWVMFPEEIYDHPRVVIAGNEATGIWFRAMCYSSRHLTDGLIPHRVMLDFAKEPEWLKERNRVAVWLTAQGHAAIAQDMLARMPNSTGPIDMLLRATMPGGRSTNPHGLITLVPNADGANGSALHDFQIQKYELYQLTANQVKERRKADRERKRNGGQKVQSQRVEFQPESHSSCARDPIPSHPYTDLTPLPPLQPEPASEPEQMTLPASPAAPPQAASAGRKRRKVSDTKQNGEPAAHVLYAQAFAAGISEHTGKECSVERAGRYHFIALCAAHAKDGGRPLVGAELIAWIQRTAKEFAAANDPRFGGYTVHRMRTWLDSGRPRNSGTKPAALQPSLAQPSWHRKKETQ